MIADPAALRILCFGDSNTHGKSADQLDYFRLPADRRWTGVLQALLGDGFEVVEEGLMGRTTDVDYVDAPGFNGRRYFVPCLQSHHPLDIVVIMLGTNDLQSSFDRTPDEIAEALGRYVDDIVDSVADREGRLPTTILVSPIWIDDTAPLYEQLTSGLLDSQGVERSRELGHAISRVARGRGVLYADAALVATAGNDGVHLSLGSHARLAELIAANVLRSLSTTDT